MRLRSILWRCWLRPVGLAVAVAALVGAGLFRVWVFQDAIHLGYRLSEEEAEHRSSQGKLRNLEIELAAERAPERLQRLARRLGMRPPRAAERIAPHKVPQGDRGEHGQP